MNQKQYVIHTSSRNIYEVTGQTEGHAFLERRFEYNGSGYVKGDNHQIRVGVESLTSKYMMLTEQDLVGLPMSETPSNNVIYTPTERDDFKNLILESSVTEAVETGIKKIQMADILDKEWGLSELRPQKGKLCLNLFGPPGTGKTASARAIARRLGKKLLQVDYASMISKYYGDTAKNIREAFQEAKERGAILFFDEADSMLSKRAHIGDDGGGNSSLNQNRNVLMQELDRFGDVVIFATNFFGNYDEALLRRIASHIELRLPNEEMRMAILEKKIPKRAIEKKRMDSSVDFKDLAKQSAGFSGSDLENLVANTIENVAVNGASSFGHDDLLKELQKIKNAKDSHAANNPSKDEKGSVSKILNKIAPSGPVDHVFFDKVKNAGSNKKGGGNA